MGLLTATERKEAGKYDHLISDCLEEIIDASKTRDIKRIVDMHHEFNRYYQMMRADGISDGTLEAYHQLYRLVVQESGVTMNNLKYQEEEKNQEE